MSTVVATAVSKIGALGRIAAGLLWLCALAAAVAAACAVPAVLAATTAHPTRRDVATRRLRNIRGDLRGNDIRPPPRSGRLFGGP